MAKSFEIVGQRSVTSIKVTHYYIQNESTAKYH